MRVKIMGAAAGGGFPQWNCGCRNCSRLRLRSFQGTARSEVQAAVSSNGSDWFLLGASPDLKTQIDHFPALQAKSGPRNSPIQGVILTSAEIDQTLGILMLREFQPLTIYATKGVQQILRETNSMFQALHRVADQARWVNISAGQTWPLATLNGADSGIVCDAFRLPGDFPSWTPASTRAELTETDAVIGLTLSSSSGKTMKWMPGAPLDSPELIESLEHCDVLFLDGAFWDDDELIHAGVSGRTARIMGHTPISGPGGTLDLLAGLTRPRKIFIHVNNTNPILDEASEAHAQVRAAGWEVAYDGMEICL
jgi:pyrroloquinoline quinone biosynthesis protein B